MKTKEELSINKEEVENLNKKLAKLMKDEMEQVMKESINTETVNGEVTGVNESELKQVAGGKDGHGEMWYCKYCSETTFQTWIGVGPGWDRDGDKHMCDLWLCEKCNCTNYRDINTGRLLLNQLNHNR